MQRLCVCDRRKVSKLGSGDMRQDEFYSRCENVVKAVRVGGGA